MAAPTYQAQGTVATGTTSITMNWPTHQSGDLAIAVIETSGNHTNTAPPSGWNHAPGSPAYDVATTAGSCLMVLWRFATSGSMGSLTVSTTDHGVGRIITIRGVNNSWFPFTSWIAGVRTTPSSSNLVTQTFPALAPKVENLVFLAVSRPNDTASTTEFSPVFSSSMTTNLDSEAGTATGNGGGFLTYVGTMNNFATEGLVPSLDMQVPFNIGNYTTLAWIGFTLTDRNTSPVLRYNVGGNDYTDSNGNLWLSDSSIVTGGTAWAPGNTISNTSDQTLFNTQRYGTFFSFAIPVLNGQYRVRFLFAELYFTYNGGRYTDISIEGTQVLSQYDAHTRVGKDFADWTVHNVSVTDGIMNIAVTAFYDNAILNGIEIERLAVRRTMVG